MRFFIQRLGLCALLAFLGASLAASGDPQSTAKTILNQSGVQGGFIVHLACGNGELTSALRANDSYKVQGLDRDGGAVQAAREYIHARGQYGEVCVDRWDGTHLPYIDNFVNLLVCEEPVDLPRQEILRVLTPEGVALIKNRETWEKMVKPWPKDIDEWTHYMHDPSGNAVSHDTVVGPPRHSQWIGSPRWSRHHDHMASMSALVSSAGRLFYIFDEGSTASINLPAKWKLIARDAFNGTVLWKKPIKDWFPHIWPLKSGPAQLPRRLVAVGDRVYATLGIESPLSVLDAATGEVIKTYEGTRATEEVIVADGTVFALVNPNPNSHKDYKPTAMVCWNETGGVAKNRAWDEKKRFLKAIEAESGELVWEKEYRVAPLSLAMDGEKVYFHDGDSIIALNRETGEKAWQSEKVGRKSRIAQAYAPTLVVYKDVIVFTGGKRKMQAFSAENGKTLWQSDYPRVGHHSPEDILIMDDLVWCGATAGGGDSGIFKGRDPHTGVVKKEFPPDVDTYWFHQRCYRAKATDNYLMPSRTGIEFIDPDTEHWDINHWVRGGCIYGVMPCNGLVYAPPHACACYLEAKLYGFNALAPKTADRAMPASIAEEKRLERGPAYGRPAPFSTGNTDWPTYRHDAARSGSTKTVLSLALAPAWETKLAEKLSSPVIVGDRAFVSAIDQHTIYAIDTKSGKTTWRYTAGGRIDSPPTYYEGRILFGAADGWVYALRAKDGELIWRYRAAPADRRMMAFEQVESVWPVHGNVLIYDDVLYCVAGRSMFLDGGMRMLRLDPKTGEKISETVMDNIDPHAKDDLHKKVRTLNMPVALSDILSCDGKHIYMRSQLFDLAGNRLELPTPKKNPADEAASQVGEGSHLFAPAGFLDDSWFHRAYWVFGRRYSSGCNWWFRAGRFVPAGRLMVYDEENVYGYGRKPELFVWSHVLEYQLFGAEKEPDKQAVSYLQAANDKMDAKDRRAKFNRAVTRNAALRDISAVGFRWAEEEPPLHARAMVLADKTLFVAGPRDVVNETDIYKHRFDPWIQAKIQEQDAWLEGKHGALLQAIDSRSGKRLKTYALDAVPAWDGMAAANNRLYVATADGKLVCFREAEK